MYSVATSCVCVTLVSTDQDSTMVIIGYFCQLGSYENGAEQIVRNSYKRQHPSFYMTTL